MKKILLMTLVSAFFNCTEKENTGDKYAAISDTGIVSEADKLDMYAKVIEKGDTSVYNTLITSYIDYRMTDFLFLSLIMADKYNYPPANYEVYRAFTFAFGKQESKLTAEEVGKSNYELAIKYLKKGAELKEWQCVETMNELYPELR